MQHFFQGFHIDIERLCKHREIRGERDNGSCVKIAVGPSVQALSYSGWIVHGRMTYSASDKLAALHFYQLAMPAPKPPKGSFDEGAASRGELVFNGKAKCATCHVPPLFTEPGWNTHTPEEIGIDDFQANRSPERTYVTQGLKGLWAHAKGGFYHDGRFATLLDVVNHYDNFQKLNLTDSEKRDLVEYLKSI